MHPIMAYWHTPNQLYHYILEIPDQDLSVDKLNIFRIILEQENIHPTDHNH